MSPNNKTLPSQDVFATPRSSPLGVNVIIDSDIGDSQAPFQRSANASMSRSSHTRLNQDLIVKTICACTALRHDTLNSFGPPQKARSAAVNRALPRSSSNAPVGGSSSQESTTVPAVPIAAASVPRGQDWLPLMPSAQLTWHSEALALLAPPVEKGEACHMCGVDYAMLSVPAVLFYQQACWCVDCAMALVTFKDIVALGPPRKVPVCFHAMGYANRWNRMTCRYVNWLQTHRTAARAC